jgi:hypothetical protein
LKYHQLLSKKNFSNQLQELYLETNQLLGNIPSGIANLCNLFILALGGNHFTGVLLEWDWNYQKLIANKFTHKLPYRGHSIIVVKLVWIGLSLSRLEPVHW